MSIGLSLSQAPRLEVKLQLRIIGGCCGDPTVFPLTAKKLGGKRMSRLAFKTYGIDAKPYRSIMDAFYCATFPLFVPLCMAYYKGHGLALRDTLSKDILHVMDRQMVSFLDLAGAVEWGEDGAPTWTEFIDYITRGEK